MPAYYADLESDQPAPTGQGNRLERNPGPIHGSMRGRPVRAAGGAGGLSMGSRGT